MRKTFTVIESFSWMHVVPDDDIAYHRLHVYCPCLPVMRPFEQGQKRFLWHYAFDARELGFLVEDVVEPIQFDLPIGYDAIYFTHLDQ